MRQDPLFMLSSLKKNVVWRPSLMSFWFLQTREVTMISEFQHLLSTLSPECDKRHNVAVVQPCAWATGLLTSKGPSFPVSWELQPEKCYSLRVWKTFVPQTSSRDSRKKEGAFLTRQEAASSPLRRTLGGGARTKCGWEVSKASEDFSNLPTSALDFSPGGWKGNLKRPPSRGACERERSILVKRFSSRKKKQGWLIKRNWPLYVWLDFS